MIQLNKKLMLNRLRNNAHPRCIICNSPSMKGPNLKFQLADDGSISADFYCNDAFEGYPGILHGGIISSILDGAMCNCLFAQGKTGVTAEMKTRFRHPVATCKETTVFAKITGSIHPLYILEAKIIQDGKIKVTVQGKFYDKPELQNLLKG